MKIICAWCNKVLTEYESHKGAISHGICPECLRGVLGDGIEISLMDFVDRLGFPVVLSDRSAAVRRVNGMAARVLNQPAAKLENIAAGMVIECQNAFAPGGCGNTEHCAGCVLRGTILATYTDGEPRYGVYSQHDIRAKDGATPKRIRFSTTRVGEAVILVIEAIEQLPVAS
jgi:hypothetical protein